MQKHRSELALLQNQLYRVPNSCIQLARVTATVAQLPGSRPMAHEPGLVRCVAREWPRPGTVSMTRLQRSRALTSRVNRSQRTPPERKYAVARLGPILILMHPHVSSSVVKPKLLTEFLHKFIEPIIYRREVAKTRWQTEFPDSKVGLSYE